MSRGEQMGFSENLIVLPSEQYPTPKFGNYLRAARLGFHWYEPLRLFIRVGAEGPPWRVTLARADAIPVERERSGPTHHRCWWEGDEDPWAMVEKMPTEPGVYLFDDDGRLVT